MKKQDLDLIISLFKGVFKHLLIFVVLVLSISLFWKNSLLLSLLLGFGLVFLWYKKAYRTDDVIISIILSIGFSIGETIIVKCEAWSYTNAVGIPMWLFFAWCHTVIVIHKIAGNIQIYILKNKMDKYMENHNENKHNRGT